MNSCFFALEVGMKSVDPVISSSTRARQLWWVSPLPQLDALLTTCFSSSMLDCMLDMRVLQLSHSTMISIWAQSMCFWSASKRLSYFIIYAYFGSKKGYLLATFHIFLFVITYRSANGDPLFWSFLQIIMYTRTNTKHLSHGRSVDLFCDDMLSNNIVHSLPMILGVCNVLLL